MRPSRDVLLTLLVCSAVYTAVSEDSSEISSEDDEPEDDDHNDDDILYDFDASEHEQDCPQPGDRWLTQKQVAWGTPHRAHLTLPPEVTLAPSRFPDAGLGVFTSTFVRGGVWLAEYEGEVIVNSSHISDYAWMVTRGGEKHHYVDGFYLHTSNWLRFVNCPQHHSQENVHIHMCLGRLYYAAKRDLAPGEELLVYYGSEYAGTLNITADMYYSDQPPPPPPSRAGRGVGGC